MKTAKFFVLILAALLAAAVFAACARGGAGEETDGTSAQTESLPDGYQAQVITECVDRSGYNMRLGAYLWYGFEGCSFTNRHIEEFYEYREPLWGYGYPDIEDMEFQIQLAYDYGLDFFAIDYYSSVTDAYNAQPADYFVAAKNSRLLDFCLIVIDADSNTTPNMGNWDVSRDKYIYYMSQDNSLKVDGKPVIIFYVPDQLITSMGSVKNTRQCLDDLEQKMVEKGYPGIYVLACAGPVEANQSSFSSDRCDSRTFLSKLATYEKAGFDAFTSYNYIIFDKVNGSYESDYRTFASHFEDCWNVFSKYSSSRYAPCLLGGWDDRPRETEIAGRASYALGRTADDFRDHILNAYGWLKNNPDNALSNLGFIYAWDEIDEGGYIIPTKGEGFAMLEGLKAAADIINGECYR
ncbi:MAG: glycoside hydrolase family 99-like domain-containing protein [Clostridia bacterium]|nr:glycoside hydrolase family 99-like domain-containing protein [Clostridia bacterium]